MSKVTDAAREAEIQAKSLSPQGRMASFASARTFIGTKVLHAVPMTRAEYIHLRGWLLPADEDGADEGYFVEYTDGGTPNVPGFAGYVSWSPAAVFEKSYALVGGD